MSIPEAPPKEFPMGIRCFLALLASLPLSACEPPYHDVPCWLPVLHTDSPARPLVLVGDSRDRERISNSCPVPTAREFEIALPVGSATFFWWGSPHRLYLSARGADGEELQFSGDRVETYQNSSGSFLAEYSQRVTFLQGNDLVNTKPEAEDLVIDIVSGQTAYSIRATYDVQLCSCSVPDHVNGVEL